MRLLDNVIDVSAYPLPEQAAEAQSKRRIGLGITGLADALAMCGLRYGSPDAADRASAWMAAIEAAAYRASIALAREKERSRCSTLVPISHRAMPGPPREIRAAIRRDGIRNALLTTVAPTGTISLFAGNVSSGVEPIFALRYDRKILEADGSRRQETVEDYAVPYRALHGGDAPLPAAFVTAADLTPAEHLRMQVALQQARRSVDLQDHQLPGRHQFRGVPARL